MVYKLSPKDIDAIRKGQKGLIEARKTIESLTKCGENCEQPRQAVEDLYQMADNYLREFGNGGSE